MPRSASHARRWRGTRTAPSCGSWSAQHTGRRSTCSNGRRASRRQRAEMDTPMSNTMSRVGLLALGLSLATGGAGAAAGQGRIAERWAFEAGGSVRIAVPFGYIHVFGWDKDSLEVVAALAAGAGRFYSLGDRQVRKLGVERSA